MTIAITLLLVSLLIIGILKTARRSQEESPAEQATESPAQEGKISENLPAPQAEILVENPPHQAKEEKPAQKESAPAKKFPAKKTPAKKVPAKKTTAKK